MKMDKTNRGFVIGEFTDRYGVKCSIQKSSLATEDAIWFGCDDADPQEFRPGETPSWRPIKLPEGSVCNTRMHLTQEMVQELLPILQHFAETGELPHE